MFRARVAYYFSALSWHRLNSLCCLREKGLGRRNKRRFKIPALAGLTVKGREKLCGV